MATLREVRGGTTEYPNLIELCRHAKKGGAEQITIHLREDRRHIQDHDVQTLLKKKSAKNESRDGCNSCHVKNCPEA